MSKLQKAIKRRKKAIKKIERVSEKQKHYGTGLMCEQVISATFDIMTIEQLEDVRYLLNQKIKEKKLYKKINRLKGDEEHENQA